MSIFKTGGKIRIANSPNDGDFEITLMRDNGTCDIRKLESIGDVNVVIPSFSKDDLLLIALP